MSFREKSAWICLVTTLGVFIAYFAHVLRLLDAGELSAATVVPALVAAIFFQSILNIAASIFVAVRSGVERADERDDAIASRSFRVAYAVLCVSLIAAIVYALFIPAPMASAAFVAMLTQLALAAFVAGEVARYLSQVIAYRRGP
jgi:hypothetical protein